MGQQGEVTFRKVQVQLAEAVAELKKSGHRDDWPSRNAFRNALALEDALLSLIARAGKAIEFMEHERSTGREMGIDEQLVTMTKEEAQQKLSPEMMKALAAIFEAMDAGTTVEIQMEDLKGPMQDPHPGYQFD